RVPAQEWVRREIVAQQTWNRERAAFALGAARAQALGNRARVRLDGVGEAQVRERVLMAAVDTRGLGQRAQLGERALHHRWRTLEHAAAAGEEQRVAAEQAAVDDVADRPERVTRNLQHGHRQAVPRQRVA